MGKGSVRRPLGVSPSEWAHRWDEAFKAPEKPRKGEVVPKEPLKDWSSLRGSQTPPTGCTGDVR